MGVDQGSSVDELVKDVVASVEVVDRASIESGISKQEGCRDDERGNELRKPDIPRFVGRKEVWCAVGSEVGGGRIDDARWAN